MHNELKKVTKSLVESVMSVMNEAKQEHPIGSIIYFKNKKTYGEDSKYPATPSSGIIKKRDGEHLHIDAGSYPDPKGGYNRRLMLKLHKNDVSKSYADSWSAKEKNNK